MTKKRQIAPDGVTKAGAVELTEDDLSEVTGGASQYKLGDISNASYKVDSSTIKDSLTHKIGIRKVIKAGDGSV